jgi:hypothetical protein
VLHQIASYADAIGFLEGDAVRSPVQDLVCVPAGCDLAEAVAMRVTTEAGRTRALGSRLLNAAATGRSPCAGPGSCPRRSG